MVVIETQLLNLAVNRVNSVDLADVSEVQLDYLRLEAVVRPLRARR